MPWGISHEYKFIFVHIPKTAGTTICSSWEGSSLKSICKETGVLGGNHKTALELKEQFRKYWKDYFKFAVVRNPYSRFVSDFFFSELKPKETFQTQWNDKQAEGLLPQLYWISDREQSYQKQSSYDRVDIHYGNLMMDYLCRYENLNQDLETVFNILGIQASADVLPHFRQTVYKDAYTKYYTQELRSLVSFMYREDIERFGYTWEGDEPPTNIDEIYKQTYIRDRDDERNTTQSRLRL